ncbi:MAG: hypothetical protein FJ029_08205 [Actinobacteria bacterium]|nr:hypothetical protein [Actinomycetota bacterium]
MRRDHAVDPHWRAEVETPVKPTQVPPEREVAPDKEEDLSKKVRRIIREIPDPAPQPGGE